MKKYLLVFFFLFLFGSSWAQRKPIRFFKTPGNVRFEYDTLILSAQQVSQLLLAEPEAHRIFKQARMNGSVASTLGALGGTLLAFAILNSLLNRQADLNTALVGGALVATSLPFQSRYNVRLMQAINLYNAQATARIQPVLFWSGTSAGVRLRF